MNTSNFKKIFAIFALSLSVIWFLPEILIAKGTVVGYVWGKTVVTDAQLDRLTHVVAIDVYSDANGYLRTCSLPDRLN